MQQLRVPAVVALLCLAAHTGSGEDGTQDGAGADTPRVTFRGHAAAVTRLAYSPDGSRIAAFSTEDVHIREAASGKELWTMRVAHGDAAAFSQDLKLLAISRFDKGTLRETVALCDASDGHEIRSVEPHVAWEPKFPYMFRPVTAALAFSPDERRLATAGSVVHSGGPHGLPGGVLTLWDVETGKELWRSDHLSTIANTVAFSPDGKYLAAGTWGATSELPEPGEAGVWNAETGERVQTFRVKNKIDWDESLYSMADVAFDPTGTRLAAAVSDGMVRVWELSSGRALLTLAAYSGQPMNFPHPAGMIAVPDKVVQCVAFSPDGGRLAAAGYDRVVRIWNAGTGGEMYTFRFDTPRIAALAFSPDGRQLAAGGGTLQSGEVVIWQLAAQ